MYTIIKADRAKFKVARYLRKWQVEDWAKPVAAVMVILFLMNLLIELIRRAAL